MLPPTAAAVIQNVQSGKVICGQNQKLARWLRLPCTQVVMSCPTAQVGAEKPKQVVDYMKLPPPIKYEELQRESMSECH